MPLDHLVNLIKWSRLLLISLSKTRYKDIYRVNKINKPELLKTLLRLLQPLFLVLSVYINKN